MQTGGYLTQTDYTISTSSVQVVDGSVHTGFVHIQNRGNGRIRVGINAPAVGNAGLEIPGRDDNNGRPMSWEIDTGCAVDLYLIRDATATGDCAVTVLVGVQ